MKFLLMLLAGSILTGCGANSVQDQIMSAKQNVGYAKEEELSQLDYYISYELEDGNLIGCADDVLVFKTKFTYAYHVSDEEIKEFEEYGVCIPDSELYGNYCVQTLNLQDDYESYVNGLKRNGAEEGQFKIYIEVEDMDTKQSIGVYDGEKFALYK